jgi:hypothetical protein
VVIVVTEQRGPNMLVELGPVDLRHRAVFEVLDGASVTDVAGATR